MNTQAIVTVDEMTSIPADNLLLLDCRFSLTTPAQGHADYRSAHIPGARYANLDQDLSAPADDPARGRHPIPSTSQWADRLGVWAAGTMRARHSHCENDFLTI